jgi:hypothetical protein
MHSTLAPSPARFTVRAQSRNRPVSTGLPTLANRRRAPGAHRLKRGGPCAPSTAGQPSTGPLRSPAPHAMFNVMVKGVLEASIPHWAVSAYPAGHLHPKTVAGEEHRRRKVPAFASSPPGAVHVDLPDQPHVTVTPKPGSGLAASVGSQASFPSWIWQHADAVLAPGRVDRSPGACRLESRQTLSSSAPDTGECLEVAIGWCRCLAGDSGVGPRPQRGARRLIGNAEEIRAVDSVLIALRRSSDSTWSRTQPTDSRRVRGLRDRATRRCRAVGARSLLL